MNFTGLGISNFIKGSAFKNAALRVSQDLWGLSLNEIERKFNPTCVDLKLKTNLARCLDANPINSGIKLAQIYSGVCTYTNFYNHFLSNPLKVAWLLKFDIDQQRHFDRLKPNLLNQIEKILKLEIFDKNGHPDHRNMELVIQATALVYEILIED